MRLGENETLYLRMCSWELVKGAALRSSLEPGTDVEDPAGGHTCCLNYPLYVMMINGKNMHAFFLSMQ